MSLAALMSEHRRRLLLDALLEADGHQVNERVARQFVAARLGDAGQDGLRAELLWLSRAGLVDLERLASPPAGELWLAKLRDAGLVVARGQHHPGVADRVLS
jgi:hypothetical protein